MIDPNYYGLVDLGIVVVAVVGFAIWQLVSINREIARDKSARDASGSEERARHAVGEHREDDR
ncbi:hypothetical protein [Sphingomonas japonica]|uniref:Uncharacterized protein n=1 Tax=Sphingomonas japonica TaxID=511662 RepID=A0ABX0U1K8_9SPHN|nr:hypothetical protein [Sphingomonas japonica]NIJ24443.1 hypothetical protein [Sphingomonas japonica]